MNLTRVDGDSSRHADRPIVTWLAIGAILVIGVTIDALAPVPFVMTPIYALAVLVAAWRQAPRSAAVTAIVANAINLGSAIVQHTPLAIWLLYSSGLVFIGLLAVLVATQRQRLVLRAREIAISNRRLTFLAEASSALASSLDYETTFATVARLAIPFLADWCVVYIVDEHRSIRRLTTAHADPAIERELHAYEEHSPLNSTSVSQLQAIVEAGKAILEPDFSGEQVARYTSGQDDYARYLRQIGLRSVMVVPLVVRGQALGALLFAFTRADRRHTSSDLALAEEFARRAALAVDNARLYRQAGEATQMRDVVLASVSHDLRHPLTVIQGYLAILERRLKGAARPDAEAGLPELQKIDGAARRMGAMIRDLVDTSQLLMGHQLVLNRRPTDLLELIRQLIEGHRVRLTQGGGFRIEAEEADLTGEWDGDRLTRVLTNLIDNAIKYSPRGGEITVRARREVSEGATWAVVEIQDQGMGIPAADLPRIFERFHRASNATAMTAGNGIGLATVKQIVEQQGGSVGVTSQEGIGSTFTVRLPLI